MAEETSATFEGRAGADTATEENNQKGQEAKTYTQEEVERMLQSEADKRVNEALNTNKIKWEKEFQVKLEKAKEEAVKLATLSTEERQQEEFKRQQEEFQQERSQYQNEMLRFKAETELLERNLPKSFAEMLCKEDEETTKANIQTFEENFLQAVQAETEKRLKGNTPKVVTKTIGTYTQEQFNKMSYAERNKLYNADKTEYERLIGGNI